MTRRSRIALKTAVWAACLAPLAGLACRLWTGDLTANPISFVTNTLGDWTMRILLASLAMTPLRILAGLGWPVTLRRLLGLFAFFYAALHFSVWLVVDHFFDWREMGADIVKRPYVTFGMAALVALVPLALTSTARMIKRLGAPAWRRLHRLAYVAAGFAVLHFLWLAKVGRSEQYLYAMILALSLGVRAGDAARRLVRRRRRAAVTPLRPAEPGALPRASGSRP